MQTHLAQCKSGDPLTKRIKLNRLEVCMLVMEELQKTYTVASLYRGIFTRAIQQIFPDYPDRGAMSSHHSPTSITVPRYDEPVRSLFEGPENPNDSGQLGESDFGALNEDGLINALMDDASVFDFWQACNQV